jgi:hypothetical protein
MLLVSLNHLDRQKQSTSSEALEAGILAVLVFVSP